MTKPIRRRDFLRLAALGGSAAFLQACAEAGIDPATLAPTIAIPSATTAPIEPTSTTAPTLAPLEPTMTAPLPTAAPTQAAQDGVARIAFVKTTDRAAGVRQAVELLGINPVSNQTVFLKPNFNSADPTPGSTHPDVLAALVTLLQEMGASKITVGDRSGMGDTRAVMEQLGIFNLANQLGFDAIVFDELAAEDWVMIENAGGHWQQGFPFARPVLDAGAIVQTCCLKTHQYGGHFTLSLKNSVGLVGKRVQAVDHDFMNELHGSDHQRRMIAEINAAYTPALVVMDGVDAFISGGPHRGELVSPGVILAGTDRVALDAVGVALLRQHGCKTQAAQGRIFEQEQLARAVEMGLGVDGPEKIAFVTPDSESAAYAEQIKQVLLAG